MPIRLPICVAPVAVSLVIASTHPTNGQSPVSESSLKYSVAELETLRETMPPESSISLTDGRRMTLARRILEEDPDNAAALEEVGIHHAMSYRWYANFDETKQPLGGSIAAKAREEFKTALEYLKRAIASDPERVSAYGELLRLLLQEGLWTDAADLVGTATERLPNLPDPWMFGGLVAQLQQQSEKAAPFFERAVSLMNEEQRHAFRDVSLFLNDDERKERLRDPDGFPRDYWSVRDPFKLTPVNERHMDHFARLTYSQLWYGRGGVPGWETERGQIVLRYGIPWIDATFVSGYSRLNVLEYRDFEFVFEDQTRGGHFTMYSPKASASSSWTNDYVIQAAEMAISSPERYDPKLLYTVDLLAETSVFRGDDNRVDVYMHVLVPYPEEDSNGSREGSIGAFAVDSTGKELDRAIARIPARNSNRTRQASQTTLMLGNTAESAAVEIEFLSDDRLRAGRLLVARSWQPFISDSLAVSDLLPAGIIEDAREGAPASDARIIRGGYSILPMPWARLDAGNDLLVYFEIYGLAVGSDGRGSYRINAVLRPAERRGGMGGILSRLFTGSDAGTVAASIESTSSGQDEARFISVGLPFDAAGRYQFELDITDLRTGRRVSRRHALTIQPKEDY